MVDTFVESDKHPLKKASTCKRCGKLELHPMSGNRIASTT